MNCKKEEKLYNKDNNNNSFEVIFLHDEKGKKSKYGVFQISSWIEIPKIKFKFDKELNNILSNIITFINNEEVEIEEKIKIIEDNKNYLKDINNIVEKLFVRNFSFQENDYNFLRNVCICYLLINIKNYNKKNISNKISLRSSLYDFMNIETYNEFHKLSLKERISLIKSYVNFIGTNYIFPQLIFIKNREPYQNVLDFEKKNDK